MMFSSRAIPLTSVFTIFSDLDVFFWVDCVVGVDVVVVPADATFGCNATRNRLRRQFDQIIFVFAGCTFFRGDLNT